jgi:hypothetical protein
MAAWYAVQLNTYLAHIAISKNQFSQKRSNTMSGPFVYAAVDSLEGGDYVADIAENYLGECVSLVKRYIPQLQNLSTGAWKKGVNVIETLKSGGTIAKGTAIATFINGHFASGNGHAAFYAGRVLNTDGSVRIYVMEQFLHPPSGGIKKRLLRNFGKSASGNYNNPSNNGEAFSVIML